MGLSSLSPDETKKINKANRALELAVWVAEQALQCPSKFVGLNIIFPEDLGAHCIHGPSSMWVLREFRFLDGTRDPRRAAVYLCQFTRSEYRRPIGILSNCTSILPLLFLGWPNLVEVQNSLKYRGPLPLSCSCGREHIPFIGMSGGSTFLTSSSVEFGADFWTSCVYEDMLERSFVSLRDGDRPDLTPLGDSPLLSPSLASASTSLRSSYEAWKAGTLTKASMVDIAPSDSIAAYFSAPFSSSLGSSSRSRLRSLWKVSPVSSTFIPSDGSTACASSSTPAVSSLRARSRSPCRMKKTPDPSATEGRCFIRGDWRSTWFAERQVCSVLSVPLFNNISPFFRPLIIDPAGRTVPAGSIWGVLRRLDSGILVGTQPAMPVVTAPGTGISGDVHTTGMQDVSALGESFGQTPLVVPVRGHMDSIKRLLRGDVYIGRGSRQRSLPKSRYCNTFTKCHRLADRSRSRVFGKHCALIRSSATRFGRYLERG